eukprot:495712-Rhodomonas_salina.1
MAHGRNKGMPPPPVKPVEYQAPTIADGRRPAHEDKTHHVGRVIPCSAQYLFDGLDEGKKEYIESIFRREFFIDQVLSVWDDGTISTSQFHAINNMLVEWAEQRCPKCNVCKGGFWFIRFDLGTDSHVRFVWMCIACTWNTNMDILCKGPVPVEHKYHCQPATPSLVALRNFRRAQVAPSGMHPPVPRKARVLIRHLDQQPGVNCPASLQPIVTDGGANEKGKTRVSQVKKSASSGAATSEHDVCPRPVSPQFTVQVPEKLPTPEKAAVPSCFVFDDGTVLEPEDCACMSISSDDSKEVSAGSSDSKYGSPPTPAAGGGWRAMFAVARAMFAVGSKVHIANQPAAR